jgi:hypothetical protein
VAQVVQVVQAKLLPVPWQVERAKLLAVPLVAVVVVSKLLVGRVLLVTA